MKEEKVYVYVVEVRHPEDDEIFSMFYFLNKDLAVKYAEKLMSMGFLASDEIIGCRVPLVDKDLDTCVSMLVKEGFLPSGSGKQLN